MNQLEYEAQNSFEQDDVQSNELPRHTYPFMIRAFWFVVFLLSLLCIPWFLLYDFPRHKDMYAQLAKAEEAFEKQDYSEAITVYTDLLAVYPHFKKARMVLVKSYFALFAEDQQEFFYDFGIYCLGDEGYSPEEKNEIMVYLPLDYHVHFENIWESA